MTHSQHNSHTTGRSIIPPAAFLACSWTWGIGMYLPVFLIGDFGWPVGVVFALPNIAGAMLVGLVHRDPSQSQSFAQQHSHAIRLFSLVTVLFHVLFLSWFLTSPLDAFSLPLWISPIAVVVLLAIAWLLSMGSSRFWLRLAPIVWITSLLFLVLAGITSQWHAIHLPLPAKTHMAPSLLWLAPSLALGFLTCPHLDATLLRTRRETPGTKGTRAFVLGFGFFFPVLILATLLYAWAINVEWGLNYYIVAHITMQSVFTMGAHIRELRTLGLTLPRLHKNTKRAALNSISALALLVLALSVFDARAQNNERFVYDLVLSFYGLVFPAYLWIVAIPRSKPCRHTIALWLITITLVAPMFWLGAIERQWFWLSPGVGFVLAAPLLARFIFPNLHKPALAVPT